jgi:hypothetical protein
LLVPRSIPMIFAMVELPRCEPRPEGADVRRMLSLL